MHAYEILVKWVYTTIEYLNIEVMRPHLSNIRKFIIHVLFKWSIMMRIFKFMTLR